MNDQTARRFVAAFIDCAIIPIFAMFAFFIYATFIFDDRNGYDILRIMPYLFFYCCVLLKDVFGRSIGKTVLNLKIVPVRPDEKSMILRRIARNITFLIWPIEAGFIILTERRLSDKLLGLNVIFYKTTSSSNAVDTATNDTTTKY